MKIALIQTNPVIGDFERNCANILEKAKVAHERGCKRIFPELAVSGYPPQDLLERGAFIADQQASLAGLIARLPPIDVIIGAVTLRQGTNGKRLHNSALVIRDNAVLQEVHKQLLPSYDVFDEKRYFEPGGRSELYELEGYTFGLTVSEDIWHRQVQEYTPDPVAELFEDSRKTIDAVINISASPFEQGKIDLRKEIFTSICSQYETAVIYVNQVGGQDSLIFDGSSMVMDKTGRICGSLAPFKEDIGVIEFSHKKVSGTVFQPSENIALTYEALVTGVRDYVSKCGFSSVVLGLSGGIDSALTAVIAVDALGADKVLGVALPSPYSSQGSIDDARQLAENLGHRFELLPIADLFHAYTETLGALFAGRSEDLTEQNIQARIRGNLLMAMSNKFGDLLLTTGNKSEMAVGYCTLYGDMSGGLAVISDVPKMTVYELARYVNRNVERIPVNTIEKAPSAELKPDQTDQDDLPDYAVLDQILELHLEKEKGIDEIAAMGFDRELVKDIARRVRINEYKRKQAPMGLKVTSKAFGYGRRYPNVQNYRG